MVSRFSSHPNSPFETKKEKRNIKRVSSVAKRDIEKVTTVSKGRNVKFLLLLSLSLFVLGWKLNSAPLLRVSKSGLETITKIVWSACARHAFEIRETICQYDRCKDKLRSASTTRDSLCSFRSWCRVLLLQEKKTTQRLP